MYCLFDKQKMLLAPKSVLAKTKLNFYNFYLLGYKALLVTF